MFLQFRKFVGPKVFRFKDPDRPHKTFEATSYPQLYALIRGFREQNELPPIEYLETVVENYLCNLPEHQGDCIPRSPLKRGLIPALKGGIAIIKSMLYNEYAPQEVADERSEICLNCPKNLFPDKEGFIKWSDEIAEMTVGNKRSKHHDALGNCGVCSCTLKPKVFYPGPFKFPKRQLAEFPDFCWQKKEALKNT